MTGALTPASPPPAAVALNSSVASLKAAMGAKKSGCVRRVSTESDAYGFRNREHFKTAIYFHCGGLDLYPTAHGIPG